MTKQEKESYKEFCKFEEWAICQKGKKCRYGLRLCLPEGSDEACMKCYREFTFNTTHAVGIRL
jgi:hypothetical protein